MGYERRRVSGKNGMLFQLVLRENETTNAYRMFLCHLNPDCIIHLSRNKNDK